MSDIPPERVIAEYDEMLTKHTEVINTIIKDILDFKMSYIKMTKTSSMSNILRMFPGSTDNKKRENLIEFLRLLPAYRTTDPELLERRLHDLKTNLLRETALRTYSFTLISKTPRQTTKKNKSKKLI